MVFAGCNVAIAHPVTNFRQQMQQMIKMSYRIINIIEL